MPVQPSPPYLSTAIIWPRQLNRWLDINAQNGPLQRTKTYITLPAFSYEEAWLGYSNLVAAFNFEGPNNFSLTSTQLELPTNPNYLLCVMWIDKKGLTHRYSIWNNVGEVMYIPYSLYTGQLIGKNFRFEIWSVASSTTQNQTASINFYTSKLGIQDYRWGVDSVLVSADNPCTNFSAFIENITTLPTDIGLLFQVDPFHNLVKDGSNNFVSWTSMVDNTTELILSGTFTSVSPSGLPSAANSVLIDNINSYLYTASAPNMGVQLMVFVCRINSITQSFLFSAYPSGIALFWNNGSVTSGGTGPAVTGLALGIWYVMVYYLTGGNATLSVYNLITGALVATNTSIAPIVGWNNTIAMGNGYMNILEAILASNTPSSADVQQIVTYMQQKYQLTNEFSLPLEFPANSVPQPNNI